ncbi:MAG TPA: YoaK family protein [Roseiarcus sp.]
MADELIKPTPAGSPSALKPGPVDRPARLARAQARRAELLVAALAMIAGFIDAYGMITYGVFVSFMSGNTTQTGYQTAEGAFGLASLSALAILFFVVGSFAGTLLAQFAARLARRLVFGVVAAALALIIGFTQLAWLSGAAAIAAISFAMGVMNSAFSRVGAQSVSLTFVTGTLSRVGSHLAMALRRAPLPDAEGSWDTHLRRALLLARVWVGFLVGALLSGAATPRYGAWVLLPPALILAILAAFDRPTRGGAG